MLPSTHAEKGHPVTSHQAVYAAVAGDRPGGCQSHEAEFIRL